MNALELFISKNGLEPLPDIIIDRNGLRVSTNTDIWYLNTAGIRTDSINVGRLKNIELRYAFSRYMIYLIERFAPAYAISSAATILTQLNKVGHILQWRNLDDVFDLEGALIRSVNLTLEHLRSENKVSEFYDLSRWYMWGVDYTPECGFSSEFALHLSRIKIPGGPKGEAVRSRGPEVGPLHFELEEPLVRKALKLDVSEIFVHRQQRLAVALSLAFGRNPLNYARLREEDFFNLTAGFEGAEDLWQINIPRIKKRSSPRELLRTETCDPQLALLIEDLIARNKRISTVVNGRQLPRSLFLRETPLQRMIGTDSEDYAFCQTSAEISKLVSDWSVRMGLVSPLTDRQLRLTPRRLRYTFACNMARQGASRAALAEMLDHTDTQHVGVYFELFDDMVPMLDKALAYKAGKVVQWFSGKIIDSYEDAVNGDIPEKRLFFVGENNPQEQIEIGVCGNKPLCHFDPPYSCYK